MTDILKLSCELEEALKEVPILDVHTHMSADHIAARNIGDVALYHMVISDLYSAGCPDGHRLDENPSDKQVEERMIRAIPFYGAVRNTSINWGLRTILADLYGWREPITADNWRKLDGIIRDRAGDGKYARSILDRANIKRTSTETWRGHDGSADDIFQYSLEWCMPARCQWGEFEAQLYDMEYAWQFDKPQPPLPVTTAGKRDPVKREILTAADADEAVEHYVKAFPFDKIISTAMTMSTDVNYIEVDAKMMNEALKRRKQAGSREQDIYASYLLNAFLQRIENKGIVFQFAFGAEPLPWETGSRVRSDSLAQLATLIAKYPKLHFQVFLASMHAHQTFCTFCRELPNFSMAGYWWHNFFPTFIKRLMEERLDMVSVNRVMGFFSDAYTAEWAYVKVVLVRKMLAQVFAEKIAMGQLDTNTALWAAREMFFESPRRVLKMEPKKA